VRPCHCHINFNTLGISDSYRTSTHTTDEHTPRSQVENALSIGGCQDTKQKARTWTIVGAMHGECHTLLTLKTMLCISKEMRIGLVYKVFNSIFNDISVISWWSVLLEGETGVPRDNHRPAIIHSKRVESLLPIQIV
jgi:hypothetical protein